MTTNADTVVPGIGGTRLGAALAVQYVVDGIRSILAG